jgi:hypothetical protein
MNTRAVAAVTASALVGALAAALLQPRAVAAEPPADITGAYAGKGSFKNNVIVDEFPGSGPFGVEGSATQTGNDLALGLTIDAGDEILGWNLTGRTGNGRFWAIGEVGKAGKIALKAKGAALAPTHFADLKIAVKQAAPE